MKRAFLVLIGIIFCGSSAYSSNRLLYLEVQGVAGYSSIDNEIIYHAGHPHDVMQKNSVGLDYIQRFSGEYGDIGMGALQMRLAWDDIENKAQLQVYNAYLKGKTPFVDIWIGHNRIPFGLASYWDTHAHLLQPLAMYGFGFDRDWGGGISHDFANGDFVAAITTGSGMGIKTRGNWLASSRASFGVLARDNYNFGLSFMGGKKLDVMGYHLMHDNPQETILGSIDASYNHGRVEHKAEFSYGQKNEMQAAAALYRIGFNFLEDNRLKLEGQSIWTKQENVNDVELGLGVTFMITAALSARAMYQWGWETNENRVNFQIYYYPRI